MFRELRVAGVAVIAETTLVAGPGFTALTGETGAGKSVCIAALRAALGGRIDADMLRPGAAMARVAAVFDEPPAGLRARLAALGIPDDDLLTLSRELVRAGRGSCRVNGALVSQATLREIGDAVADVTLQGASQRLLRRAWQRELVDAYGGTPVGAALARVDLAVRAWRDALGSRDRARRAAHSDAAAAEAARQLIAELEPLGLRPGEAEQLSAERLRLRHASGIVGATAALAAAAGEDETGAADRVAAAVAAAGELGAIDPGLGTLMEEAAALVDRLRDLALDARRHAASVPVDEGRLAEVETRLDAIARVERRHGSVADALDDLRRAQELAGAVDAGETGIERHDAAVAAAVEAVGSAASELSALRARSAREVERAVTAQLRELSLPHARFRILLTRTPHPDGIDLGDGIPVRCGLQGTDEVEFRLMTSRDMLPAPLDQGPSGGELSRLALALATVVADAGGPVLVLDEVDTGVGGETAARVGDVLAAIGAGRQVLAVTHRAEIAARAETHLVVTKDEAASLPAASVGRVDGAARVDEIARLMSGRSTTAALRRAGELLVEGGARAEPAPKRHGATRTM